MPNNAHREAPYDGTGGSLLGVLFGNAILTGITLVDAGHGV